MNDYNPRPMKYKIVRMPTPQELKEILLNSHLEYLHNTQLDMIDEAVEKSNMTESKELLKYIMEKK
jgi:hypothetical protein